MIDTNKLRGIIAERGTTQGEVAKAIGITPTTFSSKMAKGVFVSDEIEAMVALLNIEKPWTIFFADSGTREVT